MRQPWNYGPNPRKVLAVEEAMRPELFPPSFPSELVLRLLYQAAKRRGPLAALRQRLSGWVRMVTRYSERSFACCKGAIRTLPIGLSGMPEVHGNTVNRESGEPWSSFVARAATETRVYLQSFKPSDIVEQGQVYFNLVWVSEAGFKQLVSL